MKSNKTLYKKSVNNEKPVLDIGEVSRTKTVTKTVKIFSITDVA